MRIMFQAMIVAVFLLGCSGASQDSMNLTVKEYVAKKNRLDGKNVVIRGYLRPLLPHMHIAETHIPKAHEPTAFVFDDTPDRRLGNPDDDEGYICADRYVELHGVSGKIDLFRIRGIAEVEAIYIFKDSSFSGEKELCYSSQD